MGFPVCYPELLLPKLLLHALTVLSSFRAVFLLLLRPLGLSPDPAALPPPPPPPPPPCRPFSPSLSALLMAQLLPVLRFSEVLGSPPDSCAVCLHEFHPDDEVRGLANCRHVFHRGCVDRWMGYDRKSCPLCRVSMVPGDVEAVINEWLWAAAGIQDLAGFGHGYGEESLSGL
ncbi:hypothetical protein MLD38_038639 [Melastoma candidum]|uniref:Uncharacterized protein n=1 Tax=Melastoma candidum TaxID=119954 RepID=A0ACB9KZT2_9MYRT|nr:hypothetical protein MLD38_038639 [Melastoma candidum]